MCGTYILWFVDTNNISLDSKQHTIQGYRPPYLKLKFETEEKYQARMKAMFDEAIFADRGLHESVWWYETCKQRERNGGMSPKCGGFECLSNGNHNH